MTPDTPPGLLERAGNFVAALADHAADGFREAPSEAVAARLAACRTCEWHDRPTGHCSHCGCHLATKTKWASSVCPLDPPKWPAV
jgi:hypothetical protein